MYTVIGLTKTRVLRVMWLLEELGQPYRQVEAFPGSPEAKEYNALGKIPALVDGDAVLTDSVAIMTYLADKHGAFTAPAGTPERARQDAMTLWVIDEMDAILWASAKHARVWPEDMRVPAILPSLSAEFGRALDTLSAKLEGPFLMGDSPTIPDFLASHCIGWGMTSGFPKPDDKVMAWNKSMRARPAFRAALDHVAP